MPSERVGVASYLLCLIEALDEIKSKEDLDLVVISKGNDSQDLAAAAPSADLITAGRGASLGRPFRLAWEQTHLPALLRRIGPDVAHCPHYSMPLLSAVPCVVVLHDATFWTLPGAHERSKVLWFRSSVALAKRRAAGFITVSEASRTELIEAVGIPQSQIAVTHLGVDESWFVEVDKRDEGSLRRSFGIGLNPYIVTVGTIEPRKNHPRLVRAFDKLREQRRDVKLLIVGKVGWHHAEVEEAIATSAYRDDIILTGFVSEAEKRALVGYASVFAYPSLAEGFGIPVVEAMAAGVPVVTSNVSATAEIAGRAALTVDPTDVGAISEALAEALDAPETRSRLAAAGPLRARQFTWKHTAEATTEAWRKAIGLPSQRPAG